LHRSEEHLFSKGGAGTVGSARASVFSKRWFFGIRIYKI